jgi:hypothetical protein
MFFYQRNIAHYFRGPIRCVLIIYNKKSNQIGAPNLQIIQAYHHGEDDLNELKTLHLEIYNNTSSPTRVQTGVIASQHYSVAYAFFIALSFCLILYISTCFFQTAKLFLSLILQVMSIRLMLAFKSL